VTTAVAADHVVRHLEQAAFVVMKKPPLGGHSTLGRGFEARGPPGREQEA
jgi:hypothetical protein